MYDIYTETKEEINHAANVNRSDFVSKYEEEEIRKLQDSLLNAMKTNNIENFYKMHTESKIEDINKKLFPREQQESNIFITNSAKYFVSKANDHIPIIQVPNEMMPNKKQVMNNMKLYEEQEKIILKNVRDIPKWNFLLDGLEERRNISDKTTEINLIGEIDDETVIKILEWLQSWSLRFACATSNPMRMLWFDNDSVGFFNLDYCIHMVHAYKDRNLFDTLIKRVPAGICQKTMSWSVLNKIYLTRKDPTKPGSRDLLVSMIPWLGDLSETDILKLIQCGIFPCGVMLRDIKVFDFFVMHGSVFWIHDWLHTTRFISTNMVYCSTNPISEILSLNGTKTLKQIQDESVLWYNNFNSFMVESIRISFIEKWPDMELFMLYYFFHELFGSAIEKCKWILNKNYSYLERSIQNLELREIRKSIPQSHSHTSIYNLTTNDYNAFATKIYQIFIKVCANNNANFQMVSIPCHDRFLRHIPLMLDMSAPPDDMVFTKDCKVITKAPVLMNSSNIVDANSKFDAVDETLFCILLNLPCSEETNNDKFLEKKGNLFISKINDFLKYACKIPEINHSEYSVSFFRMAGNYDNTEKNEIAKLCLRQKDPNSYEFLVSYI
jgi:hypothetical protein